MSCRFANILVLITLAALALCSCNEESHRIAFVESDEIRFQVGGTVHFRYDPLTCQLSFSRDLKQFRAQTDNTSDYYVVELSEIPSQVGQSVSANVVWTTSTSILDRSNLSLEVMKIEGNIVWLWSSSGQIGATVVLLE